jgi:hypothetical protein
MRLSQLCSLFTLCHKYCMFFAGSHNFIQTQFQLVPGSNTVAGGEGGKGGGKGRIVCCTLDSSKVCPLLYARCSLHSDLCTLLATLYSLAQNRSYTRRRTKSLYKMGKLGLVLGGVAVQNISWCITCIFDVSMLWFHSNYTFLNDAMILYHHNTPLHMTCTPSHRWQWR